VKLLGDHQHAARGLRPGDDLVGLGQGPRQGLLEEHVLARGERGARVGEVAVVGRAEHGGVGTRVGERLGVAAVGGDAAERLRVASRAVEVAAGEDQRQTETARRGGMTLRDPPAAHDHEAAALHGARC
jgi:hypothetical protein